MKNSTFSKTFGKVFVHQILLMSLVGSIVLGVGNLAAAADNNDQPSKGCVDQKSATAPNDNHVETSHWEENLRWDGVVEAQVVYGNTCSTPVGSCPIFNGPLPVGAPCWCNSPYYGPFGRIVLP